MTESCQWKVSARDVPSTLKTTDTHALSALPAEPKRGRGFDLADGDEVLEMEEPQTWMLE